MLSTSLELLSPSVPSCRDISGYFNHLPAIHLPYTIFTVPEKISISRTSHFAKYTKDKVSLRNVQQEQLQELMISREIPTVSVNCLSPTEVQVNVVCTYLISVSGVRVSLLHLDINGNRILFKLRWIAVLEQYFVPAHYSLPGFTVM